MSVPSRAYDRFLPAPDQGARLAEAHRITGDVLARLRILAHRSHKAMTPHSRQQFERILNSENPEIPTSEKRHAHVLDLAFAAMVLDADDRAWLFEPFFEARHQEAKPFPVELAEVSEAAGDAVGFATRLMTGSTSSPSGYTPRDMQELAARFQRLSRESSDVPRAVAKGSR